MPQNQISNDIHSQLSHCTQLLEKAGVESARLDTLVLLEDIVGHDRSYLLAHEDLELTSSQAQELSIKIGRRSHHEPLAYIRGFSEFYARKFIVNDHVLIPRPETETMIELLKQQSNDGSPFHIVDLGSGSGAIGITASLELDDTVVTLADVDPRTLEIAKQNAAIHNAQVTYVQSDILSNLHKPQEVILANLPYVPDAHPVNVAATFEPNIALYSGMDGLDHYRRLFSEITMNDWKPKLVFTESLLSQHAALLDIAQRHEFEEIASQDLIQLFRHR